MIIKGTTNSKLAGPQGEQGPMGSDFLTMIKNVNYESPVATGSATITNVSPEWFDINFSFSGLSPDKYYMLVLNEESVIILGDNVIFSSVPFTIGIGPDIIIPMSWGIIPNGIVLIGWRITGTSTSFSLSGSIYELN